MNLVIVGSVNMDNGLIAVKRVVFGGREDPYSACEVLDDSFSIH